MKRFLQNTSLDDDWIAADLAKFVITNDEGIAYIRGEDQDYENHLDAIVYIQASVRKMLAKRQLWFLQDLQFGIVEGMAKGSIEQLQILLRYCELEGLDWDLLRDARKELAQLLMYRGHTRAPDRLRNLESGGSAPSAAAVPKVKRKLKEVETGDTLQGFITIHGEKEGKILLSGKYDDNTIRKWETERDEYKVKAESLEAQIQKQKDKLEFIKESLNERDGIEYAKLDADMEHSLDLLQQLTEKLLPLADEILDYKEGKNSHDPPYLAVVKEYLRTITYERNRFEPGGGVFTESLPPPTLNDVEPHMRKFMNPWL